MPIYISTVLLLFSISSSATPTSWIRLTDRQRPHCLQDSPCALTQSKSKQRFEITFEPEKDGKKLWLEKIKISTAKKAEQSFKIQNMQAVFENEQYNLFAVDLNQDGFLDLALEAALSNRLGPTYYYWIFNPKEQSFTLTDEAIEELSSSAQNQMKGNSTGLLYSIGPKSQISETNAQQGLPTK